MDALVATLEVLRMDEDVAELCRITLPGEEGFRIFGQEIPLKTSEGVIPPTVCVRHGEGQGDFGGYVPLEKLGFIVACTAESAARADELRRAVANCLKNYRRHVIQNVLIHSYSQVGSPRYTRDPDTEWPYALTTWKCVASEVDAQMP